MTQINNSEREDKLNSQVKISLSLKDLSMAITELSLSQFECHTHNDTERAERIQKIVNTLVDQALKNLGKTE